MYEVYSILARPIPLMGLPTGDTVAVGRERLDRIHCDPEARDPEAREP